MFIATYLMFIIFFYICLINPVSSFHSAKLNGFNQFIALKKPSIKMSLGGLELGAGTLLTGLILDNTISKNSLDILVGKNSKLLYDGYKKSIINLLVIGPSLYSFVIMNKWNPTNSIDAIDSVGLELDKMLGLVFIHSIGYYMSHYSMHNFNFLKKYHQFHHKFRNPLIPSIANSVSKPEFILAYMLPFVAGAYILNPNQDTFNSAICIVSFFNLIIHCNELTESKAISKINFDYKKVFFLWDSNFIVSPDKHFSHHNGTEIEKGSDGLDSIQSRTYSAPTFNIDFLIEKSFDFKFYLDSLIIQLLVFLRP